MQFDTLVILGATAGGKTALAVAAARHFGGEIISADSRQVYRGMDLGTGKDLAEYGEVPYHLIDIVAAGTEYNLFRFQRDCYAALAAIRQRGRLPLICGGTGLYLDAVLRNYHLADVPIDPALHQQLTARSDEELRQLLLQLRPQQHNHTDLADRDRLVRACEIALGEQSGAISAGKSPLAPLVFGLRWPREVLRQRIAVRLAERLQAGMIEEVEALHAAGVGWEQLEFYGLEYRMIAWHLQGRLSRNDMMQKLRSAIGQFAKRQETFFRRMEKQGVAIHWLDGPADPFGTLCRIVAAHDLTGVRNDGPV
jgi:tRNA dimethylallyltransferase